MGFGTKFGEKFGIDEAAAAAAQSVASVSPSSMDTSGGTKVVATGTFTVDAPMVVHFGPAGDTTDPRCYGGKGIGFAIASANGTAFTFIIPPAPKGANVLTVIVDGDTLTLPVSVVERNWPSKFVNVRGNFPPWQGVGRLRLETEDLD